MGEAGIGGRSAPWRVTTSALVALAFVAPLRADELELRLATARAELLRALEAHADWCQAKRLFLARKAVCELLLELEPEHAEARKALGFTREKGGAWKPPEKPKTFRDFDKEALGEEPARFQAAVAGYVASLTGMLESDGLAPAERERVGRAALRFAPDDAHLHELLGEVASDHGWVLPETVQARAQRAVLREAVARALAEAPEAAPAALTERERQIPLHLEAVATPRLRVVGTASPEELALCARAVGALERFAQAALASQHHLPAETTVFLLSDPGHLAKFLEHHPAIRPEQRAYYQALEGAGIAGTADFAFWSGDMQRRIDGIVRLVLGYWISGAYQLQVDCGFAYEGFGLFLTRALVRTRLTWLAQPSKSLDAGADLALRQRLIDPETNWMDEALRLFQEGRVPPLGALVSKSASELSTEEVLYSNALATYLLEARSAAVPRLLERLGNGFARTQALHEAVGMDQDTFQRHFRRWLEERR